MKSKRLESLGNVTGMDQTRVAKKNFDSKPEDGRGHTEKTGRC
jgi:hypothetical protein